MGLNAEEEQLNDYFNSHNLLDIEINHCNYHHT